MLPGMFNPLLGVNRGGLNPAALFSTTLFTGTGASQTVTTGLNVASIGGMSWVKDRVTAQNHYILDSARTTNFINTDQTSAQGVINAGFAFTSSGFGGTAWTSTDNYVTWTFLKNLRFFDVVTYTGTGTAQAINHNLGIAPGLIMVKRTDSVASWAVYHSSLGNGSAFAFTSLVATAASTFWNSTDPTSTQFTVANNSSVNTSGGTYVAYLFANDPAADGIIQCGTYTGNGSTSGPAVTLGWQPQYLLIKGNASTPWSIVDNKRNPTNPAINSLAPNANSAESTAVMSANFNSTGFQIISSGTGANAGGTAYYYMAIKA